MTGRWRYFVPNAVTCGSLALGLYAIERAIRGQVVEGAWWNLLCVGTDKLDGAAAKWLDAGSAFGVQLDSLADLVSFGVAPAALLYAFYSARGWPELPLSALCALWVIAAALRLARFNLLPAAPEYRGTPSTMAAGMLLTGFLAALKYAVAVDGVPLFLVVGAAGMLSPLRVPKLGKTRHTATSGILLLLVVSGLVCGVLRIYPEFLFACGVIWLGVSLYKEIRRSRGQNGADQF
jgi:CDP-diacylglycerol---serine O-phosphatidyltransferase